jgi:hypothetical protein
MPADRAPLVPASVLPPVRIVGAALWPLPPVRIKQSGPVWFRNADLALEGADEPAERGPRAPWDTCTRADFA